MSARNEALKMFLILVALIFTALLTDPHMSNAEPQQVKVKLAKKR